MIFTATTVADAYVIELERKEDERGWFARAWCARDFADRGLETRIAQVSVSHTRRGGTLRGLHFQRAPHAETKIVRCVAGAIHDVIVDLRPESPTYLAHAAAELSAANGRAFYVPAGCAHGFLSLADNTELLYQLSEFYAPDAAAGVRWNDPAFGIRWPLADPFLNDRDRNYPDFAP